MVVSVGFNSVFSSNGSTLSLRLREYNSGPNIVAGFESGIYIGGSGGLSGLLTSTRASDGKYIDSSGLLQTAAPNTPRINHHLWDGANFVDAGLLTEVSATNLLLNSDTLSTQNVTVAAVPYVLHFTGTGFVNVTGATVLPTLFGLGAGEENRVSVTFTPPAGELVISVSGSVLFAQLETGNIPSSHITTTGAAATRAADATFIPSAVIAAEILGATGSPNMPAAISIATEGRMSYSDLDVSEEVTFVDWRKDNLNYISAYLDTASTRTGQAIFIQRETTSGLDVAFSDGDAYTPGVNVPFSIASYHTDGAINGAHDGTLLTANETPTALPDLVTADFEIGSTGNFVIGEVRIWFYNLGDSGIQEASQI